MRVIREIVTVTVLAAVGGALGFWCAELFGQKTIGAILAYGGLVNTGFFVALRWMNSARDAEVEIAQFDETTREGYANTLRTYWQRFRIRLILGVGFASIAALIGLILSNQENGPPLVLLILTIVGPALLSASISLVVSQMWVATWPAEYLSALRKAAASEEKLRAEHEELRNADGGKEL